MGEKLANLFRSRYIRYLEGEVARLLDENHQLVNSCLANAGMQQIHRVVVNKKAEPVPGRMMPSQLRRSFEAQGRKVTEAHEKGEN